MSSLSAYKKSLKNSNFLLQDPSMSLIITADGEVLKSSIAKSVAKKGLN